MNIIVQDSLGARPEVSAIHRVAGMPIYGVVSECVTILGSRLTRYVAGIKDERTLNSWRAGSPVPYMAGRRLQIALAASLIIQQRFDADAAAWFTWLNDALDDASPAAYLRTAKNDDEIESTGHRLLSAARREFTQ